MNTVTGNTVTGNSVTGSAVSRKIVSPVLIRLLVLVSLVSVSLVSNTQAQDAACQTDVTLQIKQQQAQIQLAVDERTRRYGLMFRSKLGEHCGMLFVFKDTRPRVFTMRNTLIPLDIAFIDEEGRIAEIFSMEPGGDRYPSSVAARYALEMNKGWFVSNKLSVDDIIKVLDDEESLAPLASVLTP